jgi:riboflavin-specific deaminase-like protein
MSAERQAAGQPDPSAPEPARFTRLLPPGNDADAVQIAAGLGFEARGAARAEDAEERPYLILNMVSTIDGRATVDGRSGPLGNRADRELFHALRGSVDAVMAGAGTVRVERYGRIIREQAARETRAQAGLPAEPLACIVSGRLALDPDTPLLAEREARVVILTSSAASLPATAAHVEYVRAERDGALDLRAALHELRERFGVRTLLCEGGPHLNAQLLLAGLVDELFLSLAPKLAGGEDGTGEALRIVAGAAFPQPVDLELLGVLESESHLFLRYAVRGGPAGI